MMLEHELREEIPQQKNGYLERAGGSIPSPRLTQARVFRWYGIHGRGIGGKYLFVVTP